jgi:glutamyl/glutaminyl-tRNA synthetase
LVELCRPYLESSFAKATEGEKLSDEYLERIVAVERERMKKLADIAENTDFYFKSPKCEKKLLIWKKMKDEDLVESLQKSLDVLGDIPDNKWDIDNLNKKLLEAADPKNRGALLWPLRAALTGKEKSPSPFEVAWALGRDESINRLRKAISLVKK